MDLARLQPAISAVWIHRGDVLHEPDQEVEHIYFPFGGIIALLAPGRDGSSVETAVVGAETLVGAMAGLRPRTPFTRAVVQVEGAAARISAGDLRAATYESSRLRDVILWHQNLLLERTQFTGACGSLHTLEKRLARWISVRANDSETQTPLEFRPYGAEGRSRSCPWFRRRTTILMTVPR